MTFFLASQLEGQLKVKKVNDLPDKMYETSGLVYVNGKYLITHNDGGHKSELYVLDEDGEEVGEINIKDTKNRDWEDVAMDTEGKLYIGDFGNNDNDREKCQIYILPKGFLKEKDIDPGKITFSYEDQKKFPPKKELWNYDCEAFFWKKNRLYLITKCRTKPFTGMARVYELPAFPGKYEAKLIGQIPLCKSGWRFCSVTAVDYHAPSNTLVALTYSKLYVIRNFKGGRIWEGDIQSFSLPFLKQREGICFKNGRTLYMTDEYKKGLGGGNLYKLQLK